MSLTFPAKEYPEDIFKQTTPDETQELSDGPRFNTLVKGWRTRSEIYERIFPDGETSALRIDGPARGGCFTTYKSDGGIRISSGPLDTEVAGSAIIGIRSEGGMIQEHMACSYYEYNTGGEENEGTALSIMAYGDVIEECEGATRYIKATKILIQATDQLEIEGQNIKIQATGALDLGASRINTVQVNKKDIVIGQKMTFGAGEETSMQFDPRAQVNVITPGSINHKVLQDYKLTALGCVSLFGVGGAGALVKNRAVGMGVSTKTKFAAGGTVAADLVSTGIVKVDGIAGVDIGSNASVDITSTGRTSIVSGAETEIDATGKVDISGTVTTITGSTKVQISGALIYLN